MAFEGLFNVNLASAILNSLQKRLAPFINLFAHNVSGDMLQQGTAVDVGIIGIEGDAVDLSTVDDDRQHANISPKADTTKVSVALANKPARGFYLDGWDAAAVADGVISDFLKKKIGNCVGSVSRSVINTVLNMITIANFSYSKSVNLAGFDSIDISNLRNQVDGYEWPDDEGNIILNSDLYTVLGQDPTIKDKSQSGGADTLNTGSIPDVANFGIWKNTRVPPAGGTPADENLVGFAALSSPLAIAMRPLTVSSIHKGMNARDFGMIAEETVIDEQSKVVVTVSIWAHTSKKRFYVCIETWYGVSTVFGTQLVRLVG